MLRHLRVTNFAILSDVAIELGPGLTVLTGETGAGKSLIVEAVNLLRGGRASADIPRAGADEAVVEAIVEVPDDLRARVDAVIEAAGLPASDGDVMIRRVIQRGGRSRTYVNGALTTAARLAELGSLLIDLSGQHQHQGLVDPARHLEILDAFAAEPPVVVAIAAAWAELKRCEGEVRALGGDERERAARVDYLRYQLDELDGAALAPDEDATIEVERARLASVDHLQGAARAAEDALYGGDASARDRVAAAMREVDRAARLDPSLATLVRQLAEIETMLDDAADQLRGYADRLEGDPERLAYLDERLALIRRLTRKHGVDVAGLLAKTHELRGELDSLTGRDARLVEVAAAHARAEAAARTAAAALRDSRRRAARRLEKQVAAALTDLGMGAARLTILIEDRPLGPRGSDHVELMLASNKGEDTRPLAKIASGGELSRIMLALKLALRRADEVATYVFDEVDAGIGGATAQVVGAQIRAIASPQPQQQRDQNERDTGRQVLCVTHLPQIAAFADHHFHVSKSEHAGRTETHIKKLVAAARKEELARMLGGTASAKALAHAAELLADAARPSVKRAAASARA